MIDVLRIRQENSTEEIEKIWNKFLTFLIENLLKKNPNSSTSMKIVVSPATIVEANS